MNTPITFLHSSDWQLGMVRRFLGADGQARFAQARLDAVARIASAAVESAAAFVVVAGDVFEHNQVDRQTILRACEVLRQFPCPVVLLPGNHDALEPGSLWASPQWRSHVPEQVTVLTDTTPYEVVPGVELVGAPWRSRRPLTDPARAAYADLPADGTVRVLVAHGQADQLSGGLFPAPPIDVDALTAALADGRLRYVALGDRHSCLEVADRIWYSGTHEVTAVEETDPGNLLRVTLDRDRCDVARIRVGAWRMVEHRAEVDDESSLRALEDWFADQSGKERTHVRLGVSGELSLALLSRLEAMVDAQGEVFASVERSAKHWAVRPVPEAGDLDSLQLSGPARAAMDELREALAAGDVAAGAALSLMHRLARDAG